MALINPAHLVRATKHSLAGLAVAWKQEQTFRHEVLLFPVIALLLLICKPGLVWSVVLVCGWLLVLVIELLNSAIEQVCNRVSPEFHILIKHSKDMASAAIFVTLCLNALLWLAMLWQWW